MRLSVVVPVYNESESVRATHEAIVSVIKAQLRHLDFEIIFVDDGSHDDSFMHLSSLCSRYPYVRAIRFLNNCGSHMAIRAGLEYARGDIACFLACDLQDPPDLIPLTLKALIEPMQVVWAVRNSRQDSFVSRLFAWAFYSLARVLVSKNIPPAGASMFLVGPSALAALRAYKERNMTLEGAFATMGLKQAYVPYDRKAREFGTSKWTIAKRLKLFADFFVGYSYAPIRFMSYLGMVIVVSGFLYMLTVLFNRVLFSIPVEGWSSLMVVILVMSGVQMLMIGVIGEYVWRNLDEARARPRYIIDSILNDSQEFRSGR